MKGSVIFLGVVCLILTIALASRSPTQLTEGLRSAGKQFLQAFPVVVLTFLLLGLLAVLVPRDVVAKWLSEQAGLRGIVVGTIMGAVAPGGPVVQAIIASVALKMGAGVGALVAFLTAGALAHLLLLPMEIGLLGWRFVVARLACTCFFPPLAGIMAQMFFRNLVR
ncbi:MAG: permease [Candidatus Sumerlaeaceae bacterium]|nr:permease [Candidatus Sumerlaeaceae bacterium]